LYGYGFPSSSTHQHMLIYIKHVDTHTPYTHNVERGRVGMNTIKVEHARRYITGSHLKISS